MKDFCIKILLTALLALAALAARAQHSALKTNALYWATATPNLAFEQKVGRKWTAEISVGYNPFTFSHNKKLRHVALQPEARYWLCAPFAGHFVGVHALYSHYNAGGVKMPFGLFPDLKRYRYQGDLGAVGVAYGYSWMLPNDHWSIEAEAGVGVGLTRYDQYECATCGSNVGHDRRFLLMPTKLSLAIVYNLR